MFRETIRALVVGHDYNQQAAIFDSNGFIIKCNNIAERLATFYINMRSIKAFDYGNSLTLDFFMIVFGRLPAFKNVYEQGIDFRRLKQRDAMALHHLNSSLSDVVKAFKHALDPTRNKNLANKANGYGEWQENERFISGIPFLSHQIENGIECLVAINGGLVPIETIKKDLFFLCTPENTIGYLPGTESLRVTDKIEIDGIAIGENGAVPLFCLDINILTGLSSLNQAIFDELLKQCTRNDPSIFELVNNNLLKNKLLDFTQNDPGLQRTVKIAFEHLSKIVNKLDKAKDNIFAGKTPDKEPKLFLSMGGTGSGKTAIEEIAHAQCGDNFVIASLDEFRKQSDLYVVLIAAGHHSDDYLYVEPFANCLRDRVTEHAREAQINLLYDGTGVPFSPHYSAIVEQFKTRGFYTQIVAMDAFIIIPKGREAELRRRSIISILKNRFQETGRAASFIATVNQHLHAPDSFLHAIEASCLDKISLFANDGEKNQYYLVAESFDFSDKEIEILQQQQTNATLKNYLKEQIETLNYSILKRLAQGNDKEIKRLIARNTAFEERNVAYQAYSNEYGSRVLLIYNARRMVDFVEKRQLNPNASDEEGLLHKTESLAFHVEPTNKKPWMLELQNNENLRNNPFESVPLEITRQGKAAATPAPGIIFLF